MAKKSRLNHTVRDTSVWYHIVSHYPPPRFSSPESIKLPKNFQPVGTIKQGIFFFLATRSKAPEVGMERAHPFKPSLKYGMQVALAAMMARLSEGLTNHCLPRIMFLSASPSAAAPNSGTPSALPTFSPMAKDKESMSQQANKDQKGSKKAK